MISIAAIYPQTQAEMDAHVIPANLCYEPGDVRRYGAKIDGTTDDTIAINNAQVAAGDDGSVYFPAGTAMISTLSFTNNIRWIADEGATLKSNKTGTNDDVLISVTGSVSVRISGLIFDGNSKVGRLWSITNSSDAGADKLIVIDRSVFKNTDNNTLSSAGVRIGGGFDRVDIRNSTFRNIDASGTSSVASGVLIDSSGALFVRHAVIDACEFDDITPVANADGVNAGALTGTMNDSSLVVTNCTFRDCAKRAIKCQMYSAQISNNHIERTQDFLNTGDPEVAIQAGGGIVTNNKFLYDDGNFAPGLIVQVNNTLNFSTPTSHVNPSKINDNIVYIGNNVPLDHFVQVNCALASTGNDYVSVTNNTIHGHCIKFAYLIPNDGGTSHVQADELLIEKNYVRELSGTNFAFIWGNRLAGTESPDLGANVEIKARVRNNVVGNSVDAPAYRNAQAGTAFTTGSGVDFTILEWVNNVGMGVPFLSATVPANIPTFGASDTTPSVALADIFFTDSGTLTVTDLDDGKPGDTKTIISKGAVTFDTTNTNLVGSSVDIVTANGDVTRWLCEDGTTWRLLAYVDVSADNSGGA